MVVCETGNVVCRYFIGWVFFLFFCSPHRHEEGFVRLQPSATGVDFENKLQFTEDFNCYTYRNFYNGAGVAVGDINNDGMPDLYFSGNQVDNKLYLNKGNFQFEDITESAGVSCADVWSTGVSMADINGDGWLDIFVCKSGPPLGGIRHNELFINNGDLTFTERAAEWGVADEGLSIHAVFFDYDKDGDLDFYLLNNSNRAVGIFDLNIGQRTIRDPFGGNKLYRNEGSRFTDVSEQAGIYGSAIGFGLGVTVADVNKDGWQDIFVSNDFFERDYLYINNGNGTFTEMLEECISEISMGSMGADIADLNNDAFPEIYVTEMLPEQLARRKTTGLFEDWNKYEANVNNGFYRQFSRNVLQLNNGPLPGNPGKVSFSEIGRYAGVEATDWSWGALIFDWNNDGLKDVFVANGIARDLTDQDYITFDAAEMMQQYDPKKDSLLLTRLISRIPSTPVPNYLFHNEGNFKFHNIAQKAGLAQPGFSNGAAYGDLDNDGDLDLVINNIDEPASIIRNMSRESKNENSNFLTLLLNGQKQNTRAFGAQVTLYSSGNLYYAEQSPVKGYMSSVDHRLHFGMGNQTKIDSLVINWPGGAVTRLNRMPVNQFIELTEPHSIPGRVKIPARNTAGYFTRMSSAPIDFTHSGSLFNDFNRHPLLFEMLSNEGQKIAVYDFNSDTRSDILLGGSSAYPAQLWVQQPDGSFRVNYPFGTEQRFESTSLAIADYNEDGLPDVYMAAGGSQYAAGAPQYRDRLYLNRGDLKFEEASRIVVTGDRFDCSAFAFTLDFNADGIDDLISGTRLIPFQYGLPGDAYVLRGNGDGTFTDVTDQVAPGFRKLGLLRHGLAFDFDRDGDDDVALCGEWMGIMIFKNDKGVFRDISQQAGFESSAGLWNTLITADVNNDGYPDLIAGNQGNNSSFRATTDRPLVMYVSDFDDNGSIEQVICFRSDGKDYPLSMMNALVKQIPSWKKKFQRHEQYRDKSMQEIVEGKKLTEAIKYEATELSSMVFLNEHGNRFVKKPLPWQAQLSKIYTLHSLDVNGDGNTDLILAGNQYRAKPETGILTANNGTLLFGAGDGTFSYVSPMHSGIYLNGEVRDIRQITINNEVLLIFLINNQPVQFYKLNKP
jgi:hypothetical protein